MVNQTLLKLKMDRNQIGDDGITAIAASLSKSSITELDIRSCGISVVEVRSLAEALSVNTNIKTLSLVDNPITVDGARLIMKAAIDNGVSGYIGINDKCKDDERVKNMTTILEDR